MGGRKPSFRRDHRKEAADQVDRAQNPAAIRNMKTVQPVEFIASYKVNGRMQKLHEISRFVKEGSEWVYFDGTYF